MFTVPARLHGADTLSSALGRKKIPFGLELESPGKVALPSLPVPWVATLSPPARSFPSWNKPGGEASGRGLSPAPGPLHPRPFHAYA